jgi:hypothetical protein
MRGALGARINVSLGYDGAGDDQHERRRPHQQREGGRNRSSAPPPPLPPGAQPFRAPILPVLINPATPITNRLGFAGFTRFLVQRRGNSPPAGINRFRSWKVCRSSVHIVRTLRYSPGGSRRTVRCFLLPQLTISSTGGSSHSNELGVIHMRDTRRGGH